MEFPAFVVTAFQVFEDVDLKKFLSVYKGFKKLSRLKFVQREIQPKIRWYLISINPKSFWNISKHRILFRGFG